MRTLHCFQKKLKKNFAPEIVEKPPSKVAQNRPRAFFFSTGPAAQTAQKTEILYPPKSLNAGLGI